MSSSHHPPTSSRYPLAGKIAASSSPARERLTFYHFDLCAQALAKIERAHSQDLEDVSALLERGLVRREDALVLFEHIEPELYRFPPIDPAAFRRRVEEVLGPTGR